MQWYNLGLYTNASYSPFIEFLLLLLLNSGHRWLQVIVLGEASCRGRGGVISVDVAEQHSVNTQHIPWRSCLCLMILLLLLLLSSFCSSSSQNVTVSAWWGLSRIPHSWNTAKKSWGGKALRDARDERSWGGVSRWISVRPAAFTSPQGFNDLKEKLVLQYEAAGDNSYCQIWSFYFMRKSMQTSSLLKPH